MRRAAAAVARGSGRAAGRSRSPPIPAVQSGIPDPGDPGPGRPGSRRPRRAPAAAPAPAAPPAPAEARRTGQTRRRAVRRDRARLHRPRPQQALAAARRGRRVRARADHERQARLPHAGRHVPRALQGAAAPLPRLRQRRRCPTRCSSSPGIAFHQGSLAVSLARLHPPRPRRPRSASSARSRAATSCRRCAEPHHPARGPRPEKTVPMGEQSGFRIEHDTMGEVQVPADALWRAQTQRAVENFPISGRGLERAQIRALGLVKGGRGARQRPDRRARRGRRRRDRRGRRRGRRRASTTTSSPSTSSRPGRAPARNMNANEVIATARRRGAGRRGAPQRPRQRVAVVQRRLPDHDPPRRHRGARRATSSPRWSTSPPRCAAAPTTGPTS